MVLLVYMENNFNPLDMEPFRNEWKNKLNNGEVQEKAEKNSLETIQEVSIPGLEKQLFFYSGYSAYFLKDLNKVKLEVEHDLFRLEEGDEWKQDTMINSLSEAIKEKIQKTIKEKGDKPFELDFSYDVEDKIKEMYVTNPGGSYGRFYYIPEDYSRDVERYNAHTINTVKKEASEDFAKMVKDINLN